MDKSNDKPKKSFQCIHCNEKPFTTLQNLKRHISRKHQNIDNPQTTTHDDNVSVLSDNTIISINYQSDTEEIIEIPKPDPIPSDEYLINLRNEYMKYQYLYTGIDNRIKWNANNTDVNMDFHLRNHTRKFTYILTDIKDLYAKPIE